MGSRQNWEVFYLTTLSVAKLRPRFVDEWIWVCGIEGMITTENHLCLRRKLSPSAVSSTTSPTWISDSSKQQRRDTKRFAKNLQSITFRDSPWNGMCNLIVRRLSVSHWVLNTEIVWSINQQLDRHASCPHLRRLIHKENMALPTFKNQTRTEQLAWPETRVSDEPRWEVRRYRLAITLARKHKWKKPLCRHFGTKLQPRHAKTWVSYVYRAT
jgi:hypothetical protein